MREKLDRGDFSENYSGDRWVKKKKKKDKIKLKRIIARESFQRNRSSVTCLSIIELIAIKRRREP